ncbi:MAG: MFS transporter [Chloroflexota bacterium]|nr:MFS transporter [Chloroflexota bacterium]
MSRDRNQATPRIPRSARLAVALLFFLNGTILATWATRIPSIQARLALRPAELGLALLGTAAGALVAMNVSGYLAARFGSRSVTIIAAVILCLMLPLLALAPTLSSLVTALVLFGASNGSMDVAMNTQGVAVERQYGRPILNSFHACFSLGGLAGALIGGLVASRGIAPLPHFLGIALFCVILTLSVARFLLPAGAEAQRTAVAFARPTRAILALGLVAFCVVLGEGAMADWSAIYLNGTLRTGAGLAAVGYAAFSVMMAMGRGVGDQLTARLGARTMMQLGGIVAATGLTLALVVTWLPITLLGFGLVGAGFSVVFPLTLSAAGRTSKQAAGTAIAAVATCGYAGFLVGPPVIGFVADALSLRIALSFVVVLSLCATVCAHAVSGDKLPENGQSIEAPEHSESAIR